MSADLSCGRQTRHFLLGHGVADLSGPIETNAQNPAEAAGDSIRVKQHSLPDQIAADRYLKSNAANKSKTRGLLLTKLSPPGAP